MPSTPMRNALECLVARRDLDAGTARAVMDSIMGARATPVEIAALLVLLRAKGESPDEIAGMVESMRAHSLEVTLDVDAVDTCGTGGDGTGTFNISTAAALVVAGAGVPVAKHGNRSASSQCGSADVLEALGVAINGDADVVSRCVDRAGIGFMFAPLFHPAMRNAAAVRQALGIRTVFNILGPLANPAKVRRQAVGVADDALVPALASALQRLGHVHALVFHGPEGMDELGLSGESRVFEVTPASIREFTLHPHDLGFDTAPLEALRGGDAAANARIVRDVLDGTPGPPRDAVLLNAAAGLVAADAASGMTAGVQLARESIDSGAARERLRTLIAVSTSEA